MNNNKNGQDFLKKAKDFLGWKLLTPLLFFGGFLFILGPMKDKLCQFGWSGFIHSMEAGFYITLAFIIWKLIKTHNANNSSATGSEHDKSGGNEK
jgi:hypothetical protein